MLGDVVVEVRYKKYRFQAHPGRKLRIKSTLTSLLFIIYFLFVPDSVAYLNTLLTLPIFFA